MNNHPLLGRIFVCLQSCSKRRIAGYVTLLHGCRRTKRPARLDDYLFPSPLSDNYVQIS